MEDTMKKIYFRSLYSFVDKESINQLHQALLQLAESNNTLEFWFVNACHIFDQIAIDKILEMRTLFPNKRFDIIAVVDPLKDNSLTIEDYNAAQNFFLANAVTRVEVAPLIQGKCEQDPTRAIAHSNKIARWLADQCDILIAYHYDEIPSTLNNKINRIRKSKKQEIISINNPKIAKEFLSRVERLDDVKKSVLKGLNKGKTATAIAAEVGLSPNRIRQIAANTSRKIFYSITENME